MKVLRNSFGLVLLSTLLSSACGGASTVPPAAPEEEPQETKAESQVDPRYASLPTPKPAPVWTPPAAKKTTLENGLTLWTMGGATTPLVSIYLMLPTGGSSDPEGKEGLSLLTADLLDEGAGKLNALELSDRLGELAIDYGAQAGVDYVLLSMDGLTENLAASLALLSDIVQRPKLSKDEFERRKDHHIASALAARDDQGASRSKAVSRVLFGQGYAGAPSGGTKDSLEAITLADVKRHAAKLTVPEGAQLAVAGSFDEAELEKIVRDSFGKWKGKLSRPEFKVEHAPEGKNAFLVDFPGAAQSSLAVVTQASSDKDKSYFPEEVMNEKLGGSFTSRINMNLREDKGFTYGASSFFQRYRNAGYFGVATNVVTSTTAASVKEIFAEFEAVCGARPLTDKERNESVEGLLLGFPIQFDQVSALGHRLITLPVHDRPVNFWETWPGNIRAVTTQAANEAAAPFCKTDRFSVVIAGDKTAIAPELEALGFTITLLDRDGLPIEEAASEQTVK